MKTKNIGALLRSSIVLLSCMTVVLITSSARIGAKSENESLTDKVSDTLIDSPLPIVEESIPVIGESEKINAPASIANVISAPIANASEAPPNEGPARLIIPAIGQDVRILDMGLTKEGRMDVPDNFVDSGWYSLGTTPGQKGSAVIGAHVDNGYSIPGVFKNLRSLKVGDEITIVTDEGNQIKFLVKKVDAYGYKDVPLEQLFHENDQAYLKLITCHGNFIKGENTYDQRLVVTAVLA